jgi:magnesium transporter
VINKSFHAVDLDASSLGLEISLEEAVRRHHAKEGLTWVHIIHEPSEDQVFLLEKQFGFHPIAVEDAMEEGGRPELKEFVDHTFLSISAIVDLDEEVEQFDDLGIFITKHTLVTVAHRPVKCITDHFSRWTAPNRSINTGVLLYHLLDAVIDDYFPVLDKIEDVLEELGDEIIAGRVDRMSNLILVKRRMLAIRRRLGPIRDVMNSLLRRENDVFVSELRPYFHDLYDNSLRLTELVDMNREAITGLLDIHLSTVSNNLNQVMKKMTVISTVLMSSALIAGVYGMNFRRIPELEWYWGYPAALGLMLVSSLAIIGVFKRLRWF